MNWYLLILSLPAGMATPRMRVWRALKAAGAAVLRDGVYLLPGRPECADVFQPLAEEVRAQGGMAWCVEVSGGEVGDFTQLFDRSPAYAELAAAIAATRRALLDAPPADMARLARRHRKTWTQLGAIDFFPGVARAQTEAELQDLDTAIERVASPGEPRAQTASITRRKAADYRRRMWATRRRPKVDRLASAWLILRHIDAAARFQWLAAPEDCPAEAVGFDFDGAEFTHVDDKVTFETLLDSFGLTDPALQRIAALVHALDVGGTRPPEAEGIGRLLEGSRARLADDDELLSAGLQIFDSLHAAFKGEP
jgi:hypothetical protein